MSKGPRLPAPQYSYRQSLKKEEIKIYRRIAMLIVAFFVILLIIWFMGTSFINTLSYIQHGNTTDTQTQTNSANDLPLLPPTLDKLPDAINTDTITVSGETTSAVNVALYVNTQQVATMTADSSGNFKFDNVKLSLGENLIKVVVTNSAKEKQDSSESITLDKTKPALTINGPVDGSSYPNNTQTVNVNGVTEADAIVHVSGNQAVVDDKGNFSFNLPVTSGQNDIEISSVDAAGNTTIVKLTVTVATAPADGPQP